MEKKNNQSESNEPNRGDYESYYKGREDEANHELVDTKDAALIFLAVSRQTETIFDSNVPRDLSDRWGPQRLLEALNVRCQNMRTDPTLLDGVAFEGYNTVSGKASRVLDRRLAESLGIDVNKMGEVEVGTSEKRKELARTYELAARKLEFVAIVDEISSMRANPGLRDNLEGLVESLLTRAPKFTVDHMRDIGNMPNIRELVEARRNGESVENLHGFGNDFEAAMMLVEAMLHSGQQSKMQEFLTRPRVREIIRLRGWNELDLFGNVGEWIPDANRSENTHIQERRDGKRMGVAEFGNLVCFNGDDDEGHDVLTNKLELNFVEQIGNLVNNQEAAWFAVLTLKGLGEFTAKGYEVYADGKIALPLGAETIFAADDIQKMLPGLRLWNELRKGRPGPNPKMLTKMPEFLLGLFEWTQIWNGQRRMSILDGWLGVGPGKKINLRTGQLTDEDRVEFSGKRFGDLDWGSLRTGYNHTFTLIEWLKGREDSGVVQWLTKTEFRPEDFTLKAFLGYWKYLTIGLNVVTLTGGAMGNYTSTDKASVKQLHLDIFKNWFEAVAVSRSFEQNTEGSPVKTAGTNAGVTMEHSQGQIARMNFERAVKIIEAAENDQMLINAYDANPIDDLNSLGATNTYKRLENKRAASRPVPNQASRIIPKS